MKITVNKLSKSYGELKLFENLSFVIEDNEMTCLFGKSGSGKTTLLNILGGIEDYQKGSILYDGNKMSKKLLYTLLSNDFGFIFQNFGLLENETVFNNLMIIKKLKKMNKQERKDRIALCLEEVGLKGYEDKKIYTLSGGEQQRVAIAKILVKDCNVIFADEPTASLDTENKSIVMELFAMLKKRGKTIIIVSHDYEIKNSVDKVIAL